MTCSPPRQAFETWRDDLDVLRDEGGLMCLTLHPFVSGRPGPSRTLAWLLDYAIDLGDVWIARADAIANWWLRRSADPRDSKSPTPDSRLPTPGLRLVQPDALSSQFTLRWNDQDEVEPSALAAD